MSTLDWIQFSISAFSAIFAQILALKKNHGIPTSVAASALAGAVSVGPGLTEEHKTVIGMIASNAAALADTVA